MVAAAAVFMGGVLVRPATWNYDPDRSRSCSGTQVGGGVIASGLIALAAWIIAHVP